MDSNNNNNTAANNHSTNDNGQFQFGNLTHINELTERKRKYISRKKNKLHKISVWFRFTAKKSRVYNQITI